MSNQLSERVCRKMGIEPRIEWIIGPDRDSIRMQFTKESAALDWLVNKRSEGLHTDCDVYRWEIYPDVLTPEWAGRLLAMLWNKGFGVSVHLVKDQPRANVILLPVGIAVWADTLAEAVCRAIDSMEGA